ncbi:MAG: LD-carboxypeptidase, partial [Desulfobacterales bacterium]|nr:LD-carboxypeptidase [Desulfobacterales bacterium]
MKKIIKPPELNPGDTIGVISPSGPVDESDLQPGLDLLKSYGFKTRVGSHVFDRKNYLAGDDDARLYDLHNMFLDKDITAIFCARGGYGSLRLLEKIRYDIIKENPKILVGYSDVTALLMAIYKKTGLVTFHGPMVRDFAAKDKDNLDSLLKLLSSRQAYELALNKDAASLPG